LTRILAEKQAAVPDVFLANDSPLKCILMTNDVIVNGKSCWKNAGLAARARLSF